MNNEVNNDDIDIRPNNQHEDNNNNHSIENNNESLSLSFNQLCDKFLKEIIPAIGLSLISLSFKSLQCRNEYTMLNTTFFFFGIVYLMKSIAIIIINSISNKNISAKFLKSTYNTWEIIITISYYTFILFSYWNYYSLANDCIQVNPISTVIIFGIITVGLFDLARNVFFILGIIIGLPVFINYFLNNPSEFISNHGIDPDIIDKWPTTQAGELLLSYKESDCCICNDVIKLNDSIIIFKCNSNHFYHSHCIKKWLKVKIQCPLCKSKSIL